MKTYDELKLWSLVFCHNGFTHELIGPKLNNMLSITQGQTMSQKMFKFPILTPTLNLKWAFVECKNSNFYTFNLMEKLLGNKQFIDSWLPLYKINDQQVFEDKQEFIPMCFKRGLNV